jgi:hypothetical protein
MINYKVNPLLGYIKFTQNPDLKQEKILSVLYFRC